MNFPRFISSDKLTWTKHVKEALLVFDFPSGYIVEPSENLYLWQKPVHCFYIWAAEPMLVWRLVAGPAAVTAKLNCLQRLEHACSPPRLSRKFCFPSISPLHFVVRPEAKASIRRLWDSGLWSGRCSDVGCPNNGIETSFILFSQMKQDKMIPMIAFGTPIKAENPWREH